MTPEALARLDAAFRQVSLMGIWTVTFAPEYLDRSDWAWVADPPESTGDTQGPLAQVIHDRFDAAELL